MTTIQKCLGCGKTFIILSEKARYCRTCNREWQNEQERKQKVKEEAWWREQKKTKQQIFENDLQAYQLVTIDEIHPSEHTLYIIGNGFDLMHRVDSSYYSFRESLGKNSLLREMLELVLTPQDIWADFEESLGHMDLNLMGKRHIVDMWLDDFGYYSDEDPSAAQFYMAVETAANPIISIVNDLQPAFRKWVKNLKVGTDDRPLKDLIRPDGTVLCFNYTEFIETLYGTKDVCYIHGCRKNKGQDLIIGHRPDIESDLDEEDREPHNYREALVDIAQDNVLDLIAQYDEELTKDTKKIIQDHKQFFDELSDIDQIIVIGHSMSRVDRDYFVEVNKAAQKAHWYFGLFGLDDLRNFEELIHSLGIEVFSVFRTDGIYTKPYPKEESREKPAVKERVFEYGDITVTVQGYNLQIEDNRKLFEIVLPDWVKRIVFVNKHLFIILGDLENSILLFGRKTGEWTFVKKMTGFDHQSLINRRLKHVYITEGDISFVYNNRIRKYCLETGEMIQNEQIRYAGNKKYAGNDVMTYFVGKEHVSKES